MALANFVRVRITSQTGRHVPWDCTRIYDSSSSITFPLLDIMPLYTLIHYGKCIVKVFFLSLFFLQRLMAAFLNLFFF